MNKCLGYKHNCQGCEDCGEKLLISEVRILHCTQGWYIGTQLYDTKTQCWIPHLHFTIGYYQTDNCSMMFDEFSDMAIVACRSDFERDAYYRYEACIKDWTPKITNSGLTDDEKDALHFMMINDAVMCAFDDIRFSQLILRWPNGDWCYPGALEDYGYNKSDDFETVRVPYSEMRNII